MVEFRSGRVETTLVYLFICSAGCFFRPKCDKVGRLMSAELRIICLVCGEVWVVSAEKGMFWPK